MVSDRNNHNTNNRYNNSNHDNNNNNNNSNRKELKQKIKRSYTPGQPLSLALCKALGMSHPTLEPPPYLQRMKIWGPPPYYREHGIPIPGLTAPIPIGAKYGFSRLSSSIDEYRWGIPPLNLMGEPKYGGCLTNGSGMDDYEQFVVLARARKNIDLQRKSEKIPFRRNKCNENTIINHPSNCFSVREKVDDPYGYVCLTDLNDDKKSTRTANNEENIYFFLDRHRMTSPIVIDNIDANNTNEDKENEKTRSDDTNTETVEQNITSVSVSNDKGISNNVDASILQENIQDHDTEYKGFTCDPISEQSKSKAAKSSFDSSSVPIKNLTEVPNKSETLLFYIDTKPTSSQELFVKKDISDETRLIDESHSEASSSMKNPSITNDDVDDDSILEVWTGDETSSDARINDESYIHRFNHSRYTFENKVRKQPEWSSAIKPINTLDDDKNNTDLRISRKRLAREWF